MRMLKIAGFGFSVAVVMAAVGGLSLPSRWHTERSVVVQATPATLYPLISSFRHGWVDWSPFGSPAEAGLAIVFSGPDQGVGATESWTGGNTPPGRLRIVRADPATGIAYQLEERDRSRVEGALTFANDPAGTRVTWTDDGDLGRNPFKHYVGKQIEEMIGKGFDQGLAALKKKAEARTVKAEASSTLRSSAPPPRAAAQGPRR